MRTAIRAGLALIITASAGCHATNAEDFPSRPIILVSTYAAGSGNDIIARAVGRGMSEVLKQTVVIENRAGASGTIGLNYVSRSKPDGYTLAMGGIGSVVLHGLRRDARDLQAARSACPGGARRRRLACPCRQRRTRREYLAGTACAGAQAAGHLRQSLAWAAPCISPASC